MMKQTKEERTPKLNSTEKEFVFLKFFEDTPMDEIAIQLNITKDKLLDMENKILKKLKKKVPFQQLAIYINNKVN